MHSIPLLNDATRWQDSLPLVETGVDHSMLVLHAADATGLLFAASRAKSHSRP